MEQGYFYVWNAIINGYNISPQSCFTLDIEITQKNDQNHEFTSIIIISDFQDFCINYANYVKIKQIMHKLHDN